MSRLLGKRLLSSGGPREPVGSMKLNMEWLRVNIRVLTGFAAGTGALMGLGAYWTYLKNQIIHERELREIERELREREVLHERELRDREVVRVRAKAIRDVEAAKSDVYERLRKTLTRADYEAFRKSEKKGE